jgi:predicted membrane-bound mannosyltransferase
MKIIPLAAVAAISLGSVYTDGSKLIPDTQFTEPHAVIADVPVPNAPSAVGAERPGRPTSRSPLVEPGHLAVPGRHQWWQQLRPVLLP